MKYNIAFEFAKKVIFLSNPKYHEQNKNKIENILTLNGYPNNIIKNVISRSLRIFQSISTNTDNVLDRRGIFTFVDADAHQDPIPDNINMVESDEQPPEILDPPVPPNCRHNFFSSISYVPHVTDAIIRNFRQINENMNIGYKPHKKVGELFSNTKSKIRDGDKSGVVYKIECLGKSDIECKGCYIGETSKKLDIRIGQHESNYRNRRGTPGGKTALVTHALETDHAYDFENPRILATEKNTRKRRFLESANVQLRKPRPVNFKVDTSGLSSSYCNIIKRFKKLKAGMG
jgi:hypothetical protein